MPAKYIAIKAHTRLIHTRKYKFICRKCKYETVRETYAGRSPAYCEYCRPPKTDIFEGAINTK